jgi:hypothetical protein
MQSADLFAAIPPRGDIAAVGGVDQHLAHGVSAELASAGRALVIGVQPRGERPVGLRAGGVALKQPAHERRTIGVGLGDPVLALAIAPRQQPRQPLAILSRRTRHRGPWLAGWLGRHARPSLGRRWATVDAVAAKWPTGGPRGRETFWITGQSFGGVVPTSGGLLILDTNVVSILEGIARAGVDSSKIDHRRAVSLMRWMASHPDYEVFALFGAVEGAGFHLGGVSPYQLLRRAGLATLVLTLDPAEGEAFIESQGPLSEPQVARLMTHPQMLLDVVDGLIPWTVLPCYVATLCVARAIRLPAAPIDKARFVHDCVVEELNYLPLLAWFATLVLFLGDGSLRSRLQGSLFKLRDAFLRQDCLSAAWDLGYLQLLSVVRAPGLREFFSQRPPVLVTNERRLPEVASMFVAEDDTGSFAVSEEWFDRRWRDPVMELALDVQQNRAAATPTAPTWGGCSVAAGRLERELGIEDGVALELEQPPIIIEPSPGDALVFVRSLRFADAPDVVRYLAEVDGAAFETGALGALPALVHDNAEARDRDTQETWMAVKRATPSDLRRLIIFRLVFELLGAADRGDWLTFNAVREKAIIEGPGHGLAYLMFWRIGRTLLEDTAAVRGRSVSQLVDLIEGRARGPD